MNEMVKYPNMKRAMRESCFQGGCLLASSPDISGQAIWQLKTHEK